MLPCYWVYREVVNWMVAESKKLMDANSNGVAPQHPYQAWFELNANDDYAKSSRHGTDAGRFENSVFQPKGQFRARLLLSHVMNMLDTQVAMNDDILRSVGIESRAVIREKFMPSRTCHHYMSFLIATASQESLAVAVAAMLPCYWVYREVVNWMVAESKKLMDANSNGVAPQHPYQAWFELNANDDYAKSVDMLALADELAREADEPTRAKMEATFELGFRLEWMFWKTAYEMEEWDI
ncbi:hypothetical protein niasHS_000176 [Heterodera schachtii]|uniref:Thiaminase-2/PQQC domain-containing protein n=2 Tax=Heterodera TaxID=34509 RepID=A0ABD2KBB1_HETSC